MKKILPLVVSICLILFSFTYPVSAADNDYYFYGSDSWQLYDSSLQNFAKAFYRSNGISSSYNFTSSTNTILKNIQGYKLVCDNSVFVSDSSDVSIIGINAYPGDPSYSIFIFCSDSPFSIAVYNLLNGNLFNSPVNAVTVNVNGLGEKYCLSLFSGSSFIGNVSSSNNGTCVVGSGQSWVVPNSANPNVRYSDFPLYSMYENTSKYPWQNDNGKQWWYSMECIYGEYTPLNSVVNAYTLDGVVSGYETGVGVVVPDQESNLNHLYFNSCDIGFCIPSGIPSSNSFGGAYFYIKYSVDDWIVDNISDYKLSFFSNAYVGSRQYSGSYELALDRDGCVEIPFSYIFTTDGGVLQNGFVSMISDKVVEQNYYKTYLYSIAGLNLQSFVNKYGLSSGPSVGSSLSGAWRFLTSGAADWIAYFNNGDFSAVFNDSVTSVLESASQVYTNFKIRADVKLVSGDDESGNVARMFDLYSGVNNSVDNGGLTNNDPWEPDPDSPDVDFLPPVPESNSTTPSNIVNTGGFWQGVINGVITYDPGYEDLKNDIVSNPNGNFSQYFAPYNDTSLVEFFDGFYDNMPAEIKTIFISGFGVITAFAIYRFIRRG